MMALRKAVILRGPRSGRLEGRSALVQNDSRDDPAAADGSTMPIAARHAANSPSHRRPGMITAPEADPALIEDLVAANRILCNQGVVDGFGHVSVRHDKRPEHFLL